MIHPGTYLGKGKLEELAFLISETHATGIICDDELSPAQMANMEDVLDIKVMDRTLLILDIFAQRATTREVNSGRAGTAALQSHPSGGHEKFTFPSWRRYRYKRPR